MAKPTPPSDTQASLQPRDLPGKLFLALPWLVLVVALTTESAA